METLLDRMKTIQQEITEHFTAIQSLQKQLEELLNQLEKEGLFRARVIFSEGFSLPCGVPPTPKEVKILLEEIARLDALEPTGRMFIQTWYPRLRETRAWPELRQALQEKFGLKRQQVAAFAAHTVGKHQNRKRVA